MASCNLILVRRMAAATLESHDYSHLIGSDLVVGDADNQSFATYLPRAGKVVRQIALDDWGTIGWYCSFTSHSSISSAPWTQASACLLSLILLSARACSATL